MRPTSARLVRIVSACFAVHTWRLSVWNASQAQEDDASKALLKSIAHTVKLCHSCHLLHFVAILFPGISRRGWARSTRSRGIGRQVHLNTHPASGGSVRDLWAKLLVLNWCTKQWIWHLWQLLNWILNAYSRIETLAKRLEVQRVLNAIRKWHSGIVAGQVQLKWFWDQAVTGRDRWDASDRKVDCAGWRGGAIVGDII